MIIFAKNISVMNEDFTISTNSLKYLSTDILKLYYENAQKRMADYHQQANDTTDRAYKLIAVYLGVFTILCSYLYVNWQITNIIMAILALTIGLGIAIGFILKIILPRTYYPLGRSPKELQPETYAKYFEQSDCSEDESKLKHILRDELGVLQEAIDAQAIKNNRRTFLFTLSFISAICGIIASFVILII